MIKIRIKKYITQIGEVLLEEIFFNAGKSSLKDDIRVGIAGFDIGTWICEFLSLDKKDIKKYLNQYEFTETKMRDGRGAHTVFNMYLENSEKSLLGFRRFLAKTGFTIPQLQYKVGIENEIVEEYICHNIIEISTVLLHQLFQYGRTINRCGNCSRWFVPISRKDEKYCTSPSPTDKNKTCRQKKYYDKVLEGRHSNEITKLLKNIRQLYSNPGGMIENARGEDKEAFERGVKAWRQRIVDCPSDENKFIKWLQDGYKSQKFDNTKVGDSNGKR